MESPEEWYAKVQDHVYGPIPFGTLQHWAAQGSITAEAMVSKTAEGPWLPAGELDGLDLHWQLMQPDGQPYFPCHILALRQEMAEGHIGLDWQVIYLPTGEAFQLVDAMCSALLDQNRILEQRLEDAVQNISDLQTGVAAEPPPPAVDGKVSHDQWQAILRDRDQQDREATKWRRFYDDEVSRNQAREAELQQQTDELRAWQRRASERIKALERRRAQLEGLLLAPAADDVEGNDRDLRSAYQELRQQMDRLVESLDLRTRQWEAAREDLRDVEARVRLERGSLEESVARERDLAQQTQQQLTRLEQSHSDLTRSYRELNDRLIRLRHQLEGPARQPLARDSAESAAAAPERKAETRPRIRLT
jgi:hypothetical protein